MNSEVKLLIVDDVSMNRLLLKALFGMEYSIFEASDGYEGLDILEDENIDIIITDIIMPNMDGMEFIKSIKKNPKYANIPIIVSTEAGTASNEIKVSELGVDTFITKPYNPNIIKYRVNNIVNSYIRSKKDIETIATENRERLNTFMGLIDNGACIVEKSDKYRVTYINDALVEMLGYDNESKQKILGSYALNHVCEGEQSNIYKYFENFAKNRTNRFELDMLKRDGNAIRMSVEVEIHIQADGKKQYFILLDPVDEEAKDLKTLQMELKKYELKFKRDSMTDLYNKDAFFEVTYEMIKQNPDVKFVMGQWNLDKFKAINELLGSSIGDQIIKEFADFMRNHLVGLCTYGRLEADNFVTCCSKEFLMKNAMFIDDVLKGKYKWYSVNYPVQMHVGYYQIENDDTDLTIICDRAAIALQFIKDSYIRRECYFNEEMKKLYLTEQKMMGDTDAAIAQREFYVVYQPIVDVKTKTIISAEALVRWKRSDGEIVSPGEFIPVFEKNGYISKLDMYVWEEVCRFQSSRKKAGLSYVPVSVNVSRIDFYSGTLEQDIQSLLEKYDLEPDCLKLEITESAYMDQPQELIGSIQKFQGKGFKVLMDDFGSGYSSLNMLKDLSADVLKIDMRFMDSVDTSERAANILYSVIQMAKAINMQVVAEGVETEEQYEMLLNMDCDSIQGYYFYRPLMENDFADKLDNVGTVNVSKKEKNVLPAIVAYSMCEEEREGISKMCKGIATLQYADSLEHIYDLMKQDFMDISLVIADVDDREKAFETLDKIKKRVFMSDIPIVFIQSEHDSDFMMKSFERGAFGVKDKPVDYEVFRKQLASYFAKNQEEKIAKAHKGINKYDKMLSSVEAFTENSTVGFARLIVREDADLSVLSLEYVNEVFLYIHQLTTEEAFDRKTLPALLKNDDSGTVNHLLSVIKDAIVEKKGYVQHEYSLYWENGFVFRIILHCTLTYSKNGIYIDMVEIENQTSADYKLDKLVMELTKQMSLGEDSRMWRYFPKTDKIEFYRTRENGVQTKNIYENGREYLINSDAIAFEDRDRATEMFDKMLMGRESIQGEFQIHKPGSEKPRWKRMILIRVDSAIDNEDVILGVAMDITAEKEYESKGWQEKHFWNRMMKNAEFYIEADLTSNKILYRDTTDFLKDYGLENDANLNRVFSFFAEQVIQTEREKIRQMLDRDYLMKLAKDGYESIDVDMMLKDYDSDKYEWHRSEMSLIDDEENNHVLLGWKLSPIGKIGSGINKTKLSEADRMTGLYNRVMFENLLNANMSNEEDDGFYGAFCIVDFDDFYKVNENLGHDFGDSVLKSFGDILLKCHKGNNYVARLGGDEYGLFIPEIADKEEAISIAENLREEIESVIETGNVSLRLSASIGVSLVEGRHTFKETYSETYTALKNAKINGKNRVCFFE